MLTPNFKRQVTEPVMLRSQVLVRDSRDCLHRCLGFTQMNRFEFSLWLLAALVATTLAPTPLLADAPVASTAAEAARLAGLIDKEIKSQIDAKGLRSAAPADDAEFLRRLY